MGLVSLFIDNSDASTGHNNGNGASNISDQHTREALHQSSLELQKLVMSMVAAFNAGLIGGAADHNTLEISFSNPAFVQLLESIDGSKTIDEDSLKQQLIEQFTGKTDDKIEEALRKIIDLIITSQLSSSEEQDIRRKNTAERLIALVREDKTRQESLFA